MQKAQERMKSYGIDTLMPYEVLALLTGISEDKAMRYIDNHGLPELIKFIDTMDITDIQKNKIRLLYLYCRHLDMSGFDEKESLNTTTKAGEYFVKQLRFLAHEAFAVAFMNSQNQLLTFKRMFEGSVAKCTVDVRRIAKESLNTNAAAVIVGHNHIGGSLEPSTADIQCTKQIGSALKAVSVTLLDHIIVANDSYSSLKAKGVL